MPLDYTGRLNRIAKKAGMLDFAKFKPWFKTAKLVKKSIISIAEYFMNKDIPVRLICGDAEPIAEIIKLCHALEKVDICPTKELSNRDISNLKNCTILVVRNNIQDTMRLEAEIYNKLPQCRVCSIYEYMEFNNVNARCTFWNYYKPKNITSSIISFGYHMISYECINNLLGGFIRMLKPTSNILSHLPSYLTREKIFCANQTLKNGYLTDDELRIQYKKLMGFCVIEKDIIRLKEYIEIYANRYDKDYKKYSSLIDEIISDMKRKIAQRKSKDVIVNWVDSISNNRLKEEMPFLYRLSTQKGSMKAEYAYTCMPFTAPTMKTIMTGLDPIEGKLYNYNVLNDDMELLKEIKENDYKFLYFGNASFHQDRHLKNNNGNGASQKKIIAKKYFGVSVNDIRTMISTEFIWNAVNQLAMAKDTPYFLMVHSVFETHDPYFCPESDELQFITHIRNEEEIIKSSKWMDKQWEFYIDIMGDKSMQIYFGDHGDHEKYMYAYQNERVNIAFFIRNAYKQIDFTKGMFSIKKFPQLISYLMDWNNIEEKDILSDYVVSECYDYYNYNIINRTINNKKHLNDKKLWMQVKTIRNQKYAYVLFFDGDELFYDLNDESKNLIDQPEYAGIIQSMREKLGKEFIDIYKEDFFICSRKLYEAYDDKISKG